MKSIELHGFSGTTIKTISSIADISVGLISHHFGGKQAVIEAAVRHLLEQLKQGLLEQLAKTGHQQNQKQRLYQIVETNFAGFQQSSSAASTWLSFWAESVHNPGLFRLQQVNRKRLYSNLLFSYNKLISDSEQAKQAAQMTAAIIDGFWLRSTLSANPEQDFKRAEAHCKSFIDQQISTYSGL